MPTSEMIRSNTTSQKSKQSMPRRFVHSNDDESCVGDSEMELPFIQEMSINYDRFGLRGKSSLKDFSINFKDLTLGELHRKERCCKLYNSPQGKSLFEHIHIQQEKMTLHTKIGVLRQIALGMGYLHAKGIVLRKLNTKNDFVGHKVKVSAMDYGPDHGTIPKGHLTYIAPEIMCTIRVIPPRLVPFSTYSPETDVFAFG
nr:kinase suppressor of Ras 2-like [Biomphalaria glabrata]